MRLTGKVDNATARRVLGYERPAVPPRGVRRAPEAPAPVDTRREEEIQADIVESLRQRGYTVLVTSEHRRRQRCGACGHWATLDGGRGCDEGVPDLIVTHPAWLPGHWIGLEVKSASGELREAQQLLLEQGRIIVVRSVQEALEVL